ATLNLVGNSVAAEADDDVQIRNMLQTTGQVTYNLFNNIFGKSRDDAIDLSTDDASTQTFRAGHNDEFGARKAADLAGGANPGWNNSPLHPAFANLGKGNRALQSDSPVIDRGIVCSPGGVADPDAAGHHRLAGPSVDLGAYEHGARKPTGVVFV